MMTNNLPVQFMIRSFFVLSVAVGCSQPSANQSSLSDNSSFAATQFDVNQYKLNKVVCDPLGDSQPVNSDGGLIAELFYVDARLHHHSRVQDYFDEGTQSTQKLFFTNIDVPTRVFDTGFPSQTGSKIHDDNGNELIEYFALRFKSVLTLGPDDQEGDYEFALLSDDGAILKMIDINGEETIIVDNDGDHPSKFGCGNQTVHMSRDTAIDVRLEYYQGPRRHIALVPMWRKVDSSTPEEKECGGLGNGRYFDFNHNSQPKKHYLDLLARGWKPIASENWQLPPSSIFNPCKEGTPAQISNFSVQATDNAEMVVTWQTDLPATSQVLIKDDQGNEWMTDSDNVLRTSHSIFVSEGLSRGHSYVVQGVSITEDFGKSLSRVLQVNL